MHARLAPLYRRYTQAEDDLGRAALRTVETSEMLSRVSRKDANPWFVEPWTPCCLQAVREQDPGPRNGMLRSLVGPFIASNIKP